jgi:biotin transport system substrate-specific component
MYAMNARDLGYIAVSTAFLCVSAWLMIPFGGIPFTMQIFVLCTFSALLGVKRAMLATLAYLLLGGIGIPVFAGFTGGVSVLLSPTGGYLVGFLPCAIVVGLAGKWLRREGWKARLWLGGAMGLGLLCCYATGTLWFVLLTAQENVPVGIWSALVTCVFPYLPLDIVKILFAVLLTVKLRKFIKI